jgi:putative ABC transport system permease protein
LWAPELLLRVAGGEIAGDFSPDRRLVLFTVVICAVTALASAAIPALRLWAPDAPAFPSAGARDAGARPARLQRVLVAGQLAVSLVLLTAAGLFGQSLAAAGRTDVGIATAGRVTVSFDLEMQRYTDDRARAFLQTLVDRTLASPGIDSATYAAFVPLGDRVMFMPFYPEGAADPDTAPRTAVNMVGPRYFETLRLPIVRGRAIERFDVNREPAIVVINQTMAARIAPDGEALGRRIRIGAPESAPLEVVGIAGDILLDEFGEAPRPMAYLPHDGRAGEIAVVASSGLPPAAAVRQLEDTVRALDGSVAVFHAMSLQQQLAARSDAERALWRLLALAGGLALGLAAFGLYAAMSYAVTRRTREIGVRMAIGAQPRDIVRLFLRDGLSIAIAGLAAGAPFALALTALMASMLFGVGLVSPVGMLIAAAPLLFAAAAAAYVPARGAVRVDPVASLRSE